LPISTTSSSWRDDNLAKRRAGFDAAAAVSDRLALLRELIRLHDGRLDLNEAGITLSANEEAALGRFGLARTGQGGVLRLMDIDPGRIPGLAASLAVDTCSRRLFGPADADALLLRLSQHKAYQSATQKAAVRAVVTMPDAGALMVSMPTGSGKSLLFQIAPLFWRERKPGACVVVITPTVALAEDHERTLQDIPGLEASRALTGSTRGAAREDLIRDFRNGLIPVLLLAPEAALTGAVRKALVEAALPPEQKFGLQARLEALFIDEAHIVEQWGRSFRPDFQRIPALVAELREANPALRAVLLSATLSPSARIELRRGYGAGPWREIHASTPRYEIDLLSRAYDNAVARDDDLLWLIDHLPRPAIVYTTRVAAASDLYATLHAREYRRMALFTGEITNGAERKRIVRGWAANEFDLIVATSAFGLGVDKADVRAVVHACLPENASRWYQEVGRAARDGRQGLGVALWTTDQSGTDSDEADAFNFSAGSWLTPETGRPRWRALCESAKAEWIEGVRRLALDLDAKREGLGRWTGAQNRRWNLSLLNLMQRAGALTVSLLTDPDDGPVRCEVDLHWPTLMEDSRAASEELDRIFAARDREQTASIAQYRIFRSLMSGVQPEACLLTGAFLQIEPEIAYVEPCGRCGPCRSQGVPVPTYAVIDGVDQTWAPESRSTARPILIQTDDSRFGESLDQLVGRLVGAGVDQFLVPQSIASRTATLARSHGADLGLVLSLEDWLKDGWHLADRSTALLVPERRDLLAPALEALDHAIGSSALGEVVYVIGDPRSLFGGKPLSQYFLLSYDEDILNLDTVASASPIERTVS
jgi:ATP-dependent DNA helicase RecQ